ncbi:MAG: hypothetical protein AWU57_210 [Marinobacter sp. T13-3]|nr:MAG: hypothetical protein AWU57_210 [Marinobacter sp. T13-3]
MRPFEAVTTVPLTLEQITGLLDATETKEARSPAMEQAIAELQRAQQHLLRFAHPDTVKGTMPNLARFGFSALPDDQYAKRVCALTQGASFDPHFVCFNDRQYAVLDIVRHNPATTAIAAPDLRLGFDTMTGAVQAATSEVFCKAIIRLLAHQIPPAMRNTLSGYCDADPTKPDNWDKAAQDNSLLAMMGAQRLPLPISEPDTV